MSDEPSALAIQLMDMVVAGPYPFTVTHEVLSRLTETERRILGKAAAKRGLVEYRNPAFPYVSRIDDR